MRRVVVSSMIGNALEWYDFALYGSFAALLSQLYFPSGDPMIALIQTYGVFAAGFAMRPLGAVMFGWIGDRWGRKASLTASVLLMAIPTAAIGLLPTYEQIGLLAPILLTVIRLLQGLSLGGEFSGSITFVVEHSPQNRRGLAGSASVVSLILGMLIGSFAATMCEWLLSPEDFRAWGWRIPFLFGIVIGLVGFYIRHHTDESPQYEEAKNSGHLSESPVRETFCEHYKPLLQVVGMYLTVTVPFYTVTVLINTLMSQTLGYETKDAQLSTTLAMLVMLVASFYSAKISDHIGRRTVMLPAALVFLVLVYPIFYAMSLGDFRIALAAHLLFGLVNGLYIGPVPAVLVELFPARVRFTGMAIGYNIAAALFGGTAPFVGTWLVRYTGEPTAMAFYLMVCAIISSAVLWKYKDRYKEALQ